MVKFSNEPIRHLSDIKRFEAEMSLEERLSERSIFDVFIASANQQPDGVAVTMINTGAIDEQPRQVSYKELLGLIRRAANMFYALGGPAPGVAYMLPSLVETHITLWGAETAGFAVPINFLLQPDSIGELLKASGAKILVALGPHPQLDIWEKALRLKDENPDLILVRVSPHGLAEEKGVIDFGSALKAQPEDCLIFEKARKGDDLAAYFHTGGTTGTPKLVAHTHRGQLVAAFGGAAMCGYTSNDVLTATFPLFHVAGTIIAGLSIFMAGAEILIMSPAGLRNHNIVENFWRLTAKHKATLVAGVPTALGAVLQTPLGEHDISTVRAGLTGAALLPPAIANQFKEVTDCSLFEILGMTEASGLISIDPACGSGNAGSVGWALPYTQVEVLRQNVDGTLGKVCEVNEIGVIAISGEHVSPGYSNTAHNEGIFNLGQLNSGDLGYKDAQGRLFIAGRSKDLIIRSGHNIDPAMIENAMATHPAVAVAAAVGMPDSYAGELPICFVQLHEGSSLSTEELKLHAQNTIDERPAWPKKIQIIDVVPLTTVGKIYKPSLRLEAARLKVLDLINNEIGLHNFDVDVMDGGARGMCVTVRVAKVDQQSIPEIEKVLAGYLFESKVKVY